MAATSDTLHIPASEVQQLLCEILLKNKVPPPKAQTCAEVFTNNSLEGVYSHGVNRFHRFVTFIQRGLVKVHEDPACTNAIGAIEQWDGKSGIGITNALSSTDRAMALAARFGMGCVALSNTNHWMRAGAYARYAASKGFAFIGWSNTIHNTPAWGAKDPRLGNNPLTIGVPYNDDAIVLDIAMSQFSYGALDNYRMKGQALPVPGGFDANGEISTDPSAILETRRTLPIGYWKGSGLSLLLDILATLLSGGLSVAQISKQHEETNVSQVFIVFNLKSLNHYAHMNGVLNDIIADLKQSVTANESTQIRYPGEGVAAARRINSVNGIPVLEKVWYEILNLQHEPYQSQS